MKREEEEGRVVAVLEKRAINAHREGYFIVQVSCSHNVDDGKPVHQVYYEMEYFGPVGRAICLVSLFIRCTMIWAQLDSSAGRVLCLDLECGV